MALDLRDLYMVHALGDRNDTRTRAKTIEDNFGIRPQGIEEYRSEHGGLGWGKAALIFGAGLLAAIPVAIAFPPAAVLPLALGAIGAQLSMAAQNEKVMKGYSGYLDAVSAQGRAARDQNIARNVEYDNGAGKTTTHVADLQNNQQAVAQGATR